MAVFFVACMHAWGLGLGLGLDWPGLAWPSLVTDGLNVYWIDGFICGVGLGGVREVRYPIRPRDCSSYLWFSFAVCTFSADCVDTLEWRYIEDPGNWIMYNYEMSPLTVYHDNSGCLL